MLARRVIAMSPDKTFAKRLGLALKAAGGTVETYSDVGALAQGEIQAAALVVVHLEGDLASSLKDIAQRLRDDAKIIAIVAKHDLANSVDVMRISSRVSGILVAEDFDVRELSSMATRLLYGDIFGLEKLVPWGTRVYSTLVGDYQEKSVCIAQISEFAALMGVRRKYREAIEQCADEMLMNALYDAPVDADGKQLFADIPTKSRISLRVEQKAVVQYACDGTHFFLSVRDRFGMLDRETVIRYLHKCLHSEQQIDRKTGGAGLGLYIMANASSMFLFNVLPRAATECICAFHLEAPKVQLKHFGFFSEKIDAAGRLAAGTSRLIPSGATFPIERRASSETPKAVLWGLGASIALLLGLIALVAYPRFKSGDTGAVRISSVPPDAIIEVDGRARGSTSASPLTVGDLEVGRTYRVTARKPGYQTAELVLEASSGESPIVLQLAPLSSRVTVDSDPSGATVWMDDRELGQTPFIATEWAPGTTVEVTLRKPGFSDATRSIRVPAAGGESQVSAALAIAPTVATLSFVSEPAGATVLHNGQLIAGKLTPFDGHLVESGVNHSFAFSLPGYMPATVSLKPGRGARDVPVSVTLSPGGAIAVDANFEGTASVAGVSECRRVPLPMAGCPVPNGNYLVRVDGTRPFARAEFQVTVNGDTAIATLNYGTVEARAGHKINHLGRSLKKLALDDGKHTLSVVSDAGETKTVEVRVTAGKLTLVP